MIYFKNTMILHQSVKIVVQKSCLSAMMTITILQDIILWKAMIMK